MHNGFLQVEGEKMSKSLGNFVTIHQLLTNWHGYRWPGEAIRFNLLRTHYRQPLDWTLEGLDESHKTLWNWYSELEGVAAASEVPESVLDAIADDLNTPRLIAELHSARSLPERLRVLQMLGFSGQRPNIERFAIAAGRAEGRSSAIGVGSAHLAMTGFAPTVSVRPSDEKIAGLITARNAARKAKNFKEADRIRDELLAQGIVLKDGPEGTTWELKR